MLDLRVFEDMCDDCPAGEILSLNLSTFNLKWKAKYLNQDACG